MGVGRKQTKKRARKNGIVTKRNKRPKRPARINKPTDLFREAWDNTKTLQENYAEVGLTFDPNEEVLKKHIELMDAGLIPEYEDPDDFDPEAVEIEEDVEGKEKLKELLDVREEADPRQPKLGVRERVYIQKLIAKYGTNYKAMTRDMKLNYNQYTKKQLKQKCKVFEDFYRNPIDYTTLNQQRREERKAQSALNGTSNNHNLPKKKKQQEPESEEFEEGDDEDMEEYSGEENEDEEDDEEMSGEEDMDDEDEEEDDDLNESDIDDLVDEDDEPAPKHRSKNNNNRSHNNANQFGGRRKKQRATVFRDK